MRSLPVLLLGEHLALALRLQAYQYSANHQIPKVAALHARHLATAAPPGDASEGGNAKWWMPSLPKWVERRLPEVLGGPRRSYRWEHRSCVSENFTFDGEFLECLQDAWGDTRSSHKLMASRPAGAQTMHATWPRPGVPAASPASCAAQATYFIPKPSKRFASSGPSWGRCETWKRPTWRASGWRSGRGWRRRRGAPRLRWTNASPGTSG